MKPRPTVEDVARLSGVSTATVSRVLNAPAQVRHETRQRVTDAVAQLGYTPNYRARALASKRSDTIGAIIPTMENAIFARGLQALQEELASAGVTLLVATSNYDHERELEHIRTLLARGVDGLVLIGEARDDTTYRLLEEWGVPVVLVWWWRQDCPWPCVGFDNRGAVRALAERVLDLGHTRVGMIAGITHYNDRAQARIDGVHDALAARGLEFAGGHPLETPYTLEAGTAAALQLLGVPSPPTALICGNDVLAAGAALAMRRNGLKIPGDMSITGFDDIDLAILLDPPLTTVHVPHRRMGQSAAELILRIRNGTADTNSIVYTAEIIERGSLAAR